MLMGLKSVKIDAQEVLGTGVTMAFFHREGTLPETREILKMRARGRHRCSAYVLKKIDGIPSAVAEKEALLALRYLWISLGVIIGRGQSEHERLFSRGQVELGVLKTFEK
ncbi:hypothetical protein Y032_1083g3573 [Ancylostoma ceylanicum]|uniref:Uncharacterized protein n=1 Tax=Ancylostoma ceylanicum TaxID=53326 RepID=A0A016W627_9BILA|nr:hypothetical protein Y032_1083g3573 [Ancylostoma ceylanicum]